MENLMKKETITETFDSYEEVFSLINAFAALERHGCIYSVHMSSKSCILKIGKKIVIRKPIITLRYQFEPAPHS